MALGCHVNFFLYILLWNFDMLLNLIEWIGTFWTSNLILKEEKNYLLLLLLLDL